MNDKNKAYIKLYPTISSFKRFTHPKKVSLRDKCGRKGFHCKLLNLCCCVIIVVTVGEKKEMRGSEKTLAINIQGT